jgi:ASC-1-like (ASCH) protein
MSNIPVKVSKDLPLSAACELGSKFKDLPLSAACELGSQFEDLPLSAACELGSKFEDILIIKVNSPWFEYIKEGKKIYEGRSGKKEYLLNSEYYIANNNDINNRFKVKFIACFKFINFEEAMIQLSIEKVLPNINNIEDGIEVYKKYVSLNTQKIYGVNMWQIQLI